MTGKEKRPHGAPGSARGRARVPREAETGASLSDSGGPIANGASFRQLVDRAVAGVYVSTPEGRILYCNDALARMMGYESAQALQSAGALELYRDSDDRARWRRLLEERGAVENYEEALRRRDGSILHVLENARVVRDERDRVVAYEGSLIDITDRVEAVAEARELERQLRHAQKLEALGGLAAGVAHDFNNVLGGILNLAQAAVTAVDPSDPLWPILDQLAHVARRGGSLTRQLLAFARQVEPGLQPVDLNAHLTETREFLARSIGPEYVVEVEIAGRLPNVLADAAQLQQILVNLCLNARDAMPEGGAIRMRAREAERVPVVLETRSPGRRYAVIEVEDEGTGIAPEHLDRVFEPFFTTKPPGQGTGLGLAVVYGILERHEGIIDVETRVGRGSVFRVYLPLAPGA